jgi:formate hydrogenlyase subunit 6/NADH:ubiquinone oxidoreductase subunit I
MIKKVFEKPLSWLERILFIDFIKGLSVTIRHAFSKTITTHYPYEKLTPPKRFRGFLVIRWWMAGSHSLPLRSGWRGLRLKWNPAKAGVWYVCCVKGLALFLSSLR